MVRPLTLRRASWVALFHHNQYIEVEKAIVNRSNQSVGHAVGDQAEMLHSAGRIDNDEVVFLGSSDFLELRYELPQVSAGAQRATAGEVLFVRSANFLESRYEPPQDRARALLRDRKMIGQLQFLLVLPIPFMSIPEVPREGFVGLSRDRNTPRVGGTTDVRIAGSFPAIEKRTSPTPRIIAPGR